MSWLGPVLTADQREIAQVVTRLVTDLVPGDPVAVAALPRQLAGLGLWTVGVPARIGGSGADWATAALVIERLSRAAPEIGIACAHAHAAALALAGPGHDELLGRLHAGEAEVVVVEAASPHVAIHADGERFTGRLDRFDALRPEGAHLVLLGEAPALVDPAAVMVGPAQRTTGLASLRTAPLDLDGRLGQTVHALRVDVAAIRSQLLGGVAAVAAGIAGAAFDAAAAYANQRRQFGAPIAALPAVRQSLDNQALRTAGLLHALAAGAPDALGALALAREGLDVALDVADEALQVHGGYGYLREFPAERSVRDAVSLRATVCLSGQSSIPTTTVSAHV